jgi:hypothetical protein
VQLVEHYRSGPNANAQTFLTPSESKKTTLTGLDHTGEEGLVLEVGVVLLEVLLGRGSELEGSDLEAALLEAGDDLTDETALDAVRLDHDVSLLVV